MTTSPYLRTRNIDDGAIALIRDDDAYRVNAWNQSDDTFLDIETAEHDGTPASRLDALRLAMEVYRSVIESGISAQDLIAATSDRM